LLTAYNVAAGRLWALVPLWMAIGPEIVRRLHDSFHGPSPANWSRRGRDEDAYR
jgi:hypothetical protein